MMIKLAGALIVLGLGVAFVAADVGAETPAPDKAAPAPEEPATVAKDPAALSADFWGDLNKIKASPEFAALSDAVGCADKTRAKTADAAKSNKQGIVDIAITRPEEAAKFLNEATTSSSGAVSDGALATVITMRTSPEVLEAAAPMIAPEAQARVEEFRADLTTGIPGLPGIYLGDNSGATSSARAEAPTGYTPVSGGSIACPSR